MSTTSSENATSLKYEKTQNRDVINTIERLNRSQLFKPDAEEILTRFNKVVRETAIAIFKEEWRSNHEGHENPKNLTVEVSIGSPLYKKSAEGSFYSMSLSTTFCVDEAAKEGETQSDVASSLDAWFSEKISGRLNRKVVERLKAATEDERFSKKFWFPLFDGDDSKSCVIGKTPKFDVINVSYMSSIRLRKSDSSTIDVVPFDDSDSVRDGLISNVAMAFERTTTSNN